MALVPVGVLPIGVVFNSGNGYIYVTNYGAPGSVTVIDGTSVVATVTVGDLPGGLAYDSGNGYVYVTNFNSNTVSVINGTTVVATVPVGSSPGGIVYDRGKGYVYVTTNQNSGTVSVIQGTTVMATIAVGNFPLGGVYDSGNGYIYVVNGDPNQSFGTLSVIKETKLVATIPVGPIPYGVAYDSGNGYVYVANSGSSTVSVISTISDFTVSSSPISLTVSGESSLCEGRTTICDDEASTDVSVTSLDGFKGDVRLTTSVSPSDGSLTVYCRPPSILVKPGGASKVICTVEPEINHDSPRTYTVAIRATSGSLSHFIDIIVTVIPAPVG